MECLSTLLNVLLLKHNGMFEHIVYCLVAETQWNVWAHCLLSCCWNTMECLSTLFTVLLLKHNGMFEHIVYCLVAETQWNVWAHCLLSCCWNNIQFHLILIHVIIMQICCIKGDRIISCSLKCWYIKLSILI